MTETESPDRGEDGHWPIWNPYGFEWGPVTVTRIAQIDGRVVLGIETGSKKLNVYVAPQGRSVRVYEPGKGEWKPQQN